MKITLLLAIHNHQPVGNFDHVLEDSYQRAYLPLMRVLQGHRNIRITLHYSGILLKWFLRFHPEFIGYIKEMVERGRIELLGGGFYEPVLPAIPDEDKIGQIQKMRDFIKGQFGSTPQGMWLAERVWEPSLAKAIAEAGVRYTMVDDFHFKKSGLREGQLFGYYVTEETGKTIAIFPGSERLRYLIPFHPPEEAIEYLHTVYNQGGKMALMADDGEKFGIWPGTYKTVYEEGWLERFFALMEENSDWLITSNCSEYLKQEGPLGLIYLPTASYRELGEWVLPVDVIYEYEDLLKEIERRPDPERAKAFLSGGIWRNFLSKYPEANTLHKKMLYVSEKVHKIVESLELGVENKDELLDELWQGQCNDAYWHGIFGGLYLPHLRSALYHHLIKAEAMADNYLYSSQERLEVVERDMDADTYPEVLISTPYVNIYIDPDQGGTIYELDYKPIARNLMDNLSRRREGYHRKMDQIAAEEGKGVKTIHERMTIKEEGLSDLLYYDWYRRGSLIDHFLGPDTDLAGFKDCRYEEWGDFVKGRFGPKVIREGEGILVNMIRDGMVKNKAVFVSKSLKAIKNVSGFEISYEVTNRGHERLDMRFGVEFNFSLSAGKAPDRYYRIPGQVLREKDLSSIGEDTDIIEVSMVDEFLGISIKLASTEKALLWRFPIETVSQSEGGIERVYQSSVLFPHWHLRLEPGDLWTTSLSVMVEKI